MDKSKIIIKVNQIQFGYGETGEISNANVSYTGEDNSRTTIISGNLIMTTEEYFANSSLANLRNKINTHLVEKLTEETV